MILLNTSALFGITSLASLAAARAPGMSPSDRSRLMRFVAKLNCVGAYF